MAWGSGGRRFCLWRAWRVARGGYRSGNAVSISGRVILEAIGTARGRGNTAVEEWFEIPTLRAAGVRAAVFCFGVRAGAEGPYSGVLASGFDMAKPATIVALLGGGGRVGSLTGLAATEDRNFRDLSQKIPIFRRHLYEHSEGLFVVVVRAAVRVEEAGIGYEERPGIDDRGLEEITQVCIVVGIGLD